MFERKKEGFIIQSGRPNAEDGQIEEGFSPGIGNKVINLAQGIRNFRFHRPKLGNPGRVLSQAGEKMVKAQFKSESEQLTQKVLDLEEMDARHQQLIVPMRQSAEMAKAIRNKAARVFVWSFAYDFYKNPNDPRVQARLEHWALENRQLFGSQHRGEDLEVVGKSLRPIFNEIAGKIKRIEEGKEAFF